MAIRLYTPMNRLAAALFALACAFVAAWAFAYLFRPLQGGDAFAAQFARSGLDVPAHFFGGGLALLLAPLQLSTALRRRWPRAHRIAGGLYTAGVLIAGLAALSLARHSQGGAVTGIAFTLLGLAWIATTATGIVHVARGRYDAHRRWMWRSIALTASAVTLRLTLGIGLGVLHLDGAAVYAFAAWSCWTINLAVCECLLRRPMRRRASAAVAH